MGKLKSRLIELMYEAFENGAENENDVLVYVRTYFPDIDIDRHRELFDEVWEQDQNWECQE